MGLVALDRWSCLECWDEFDLPVSFALLGEFPVCCPSCGSWRIVKNGNYEPTEVLVSSVPATRWSTS